MTSAEPEGLATWAIPKITPRGRANRCAGRDQDSLRNVRLGELETARQQTLTSVARIGAIQNRLERLSGDLQDAVIELEEVLSDKIDADFA